MDKREFLNVLRQSLRGEVSSEVFEQNINYYDQYIGSKTVDEETKILNELGDPRLIAKTIIESEKAAKQKGKYTGNQSYQTYYNNEEDAENNTENSDPSRRTFSTNFKWYHKLFFAFIILIIFLIFILIGKIMISLFAFFLPLILVIMVLTMLRRR